jgi:hypothetical protein
MCKLDLFYNELTNHLMNVSKLTHSRKFSMLYEKFINTSLGTRQREDAFVKLKSYLQSNVNKNIGFNTTYTTILDTTGKLFVDDVIPHEQSICAGCVGSASDPDVMIAKLRIANVSVKMKNYSPEIKILTDDVTKEDLQICQEIKKVIKHYIKKQWVVTTATNIYSKLKDFMPSDHPVLPIHNYLCFTKEVDKSYVNAYGGSYIVKTYIKVPKNMNIKLN